MTIYEELTHDHDEVRALLAEISEMSSRATKSKERSFEKLKALMTAHSRAEEKVFYDALKSAAAAKDDALEGYEEHHVVDVLLREIARLTPGDDRWKAKFSVLRETIEHHAQEEETEIFDKARGILSDDDAEKLGEKFLATRDKLVKAEA